MSHFMFYLDCMFVLLVIKAENRRLGIIARLSAGQTKPTVSQAKSIM